MKLVRSLTRLSWALTLLGADRAGRALMGRPRAGERGNAPIRERDPLDTVSTAAAGEMSGLARRFYDAGDRCQNGFFDTLGRLGTKNWFRPGDMMDRAWQGTLSGPETRDPR